MKNQCCDRKIMKWDTKRTNAQTGTLIKSKKKTQYVLWTIYYKFPCNSFAFPVYNIRKLKQQV